MRHTSFFDEIVDRRHLIERFVNSLGEVEDHILCKTLMEKGFIMDNIQMVVDELLLDGPVIALNYAIDLGTSGIDKQMGDIGFSEGCFELTEVL